MRFSSDRQHIGDSLRRQLALASRYALDHDLELDTTSYRDLGISAFKGQNAAQGKLGMFLRALELGLVEDDSLLLVESLDRLSRDDVDEALELFLSLIRRGVTIVTLSDGREYNRHTIKRDHGISLIVSISVMIRAHEESETKSARCKEAWARRAMKGGIEGSCSYPSWLRIVEGRWALDREKAETDFRHVPSFRRDVGHRQTPQ